MPLVLSAKTFADFDDQMRAVKGVTQASGEEFERLTAKAKQLGASTSFTAGQVAALMTLSELTRGNAPDFVGVLGLPFLARYRLDIDYPEYPDEKAKPATVFVRPHELEIDRKRPGGSSLPAQVVRINAAGAAVKVELSSSEFGALVNVVLSQERLAQLELRPGDAVYVFPKRVRVFVQDYSI